jgi:hypothetical protein
MWEPSLVVTEIEADNAMDAKDMVMSAIRDGRITHDDYMTTSTPVRTQLLTVRRARVE